MTKRKSSKLIPAFVALIIFLIGTIFFLFLFRKLDVVVQPSITTQKPTTQTAFSDSYYLCKVDKEFADSVQSDPACKGQGSRCADGWSVKVYYDRRSITTPPKDNSSLRIPEELTQAIIARYDKSSCKCITPVSYQVLVEKNLEETDCINFYEFIKNYNSSCNNCVLTWKTGCC